MGDEIQFNNFNFDVDESLYFEKPSSLFLPYNRTICTGCGIRQIIIPLLNGLIREAVVVTTRPQINLNLFKMSESGFEVPI